MGSRKTFNVFVALLLVLAIFATSAFSEACFCGRACLHGFQSKSNLKVSSLFHMRCKGGLCKGCDLEESQNLKIANRLVPQTTNIKIFDNALNLSASIAYPSRYHIIEPIDSVCVCEIAPSTPIYLQKLSLLC